MTLDGGNNINNTPSRIRGWLTNANDEEVHQVLLSGEFPTGAPSEPEEVALPAPSTSPTQRNILQFYHSSANNEESENPIQREPLGLLRRGSTYSLTQLLQRQSIETQITNATTSVGNVSIGEECLETTGIFINGSREKGLWYADMPGR